MKGSGINYFMEYFGFTSGKFKVFYTFEQTGGSFVPSVPDAYGAFSGELTSVNDFWSNTGSGLFSGNFVQVNNASGLSSDSFTHFFSFERIKTGSAILFSNYDVSGYEIGLTSTNKLYFRCNPGQDTTIASYINLSQKNLCAVSYVANFLTFNYYNFNAQSFESESFNLYAGILRSDNWRLGESYTGYMDYYLYFDDYYNQNVLNQIASGFYNIPTGTGVNIQTNCFSSITGFVQTNYVLTGITGYKTTTSGNGGFGSFGVAFPTTTITIPLTGIISSGTIPSGITGLSCTTFTGANETLFQTLNGYASGFGMNKILLLNKVEFGDIIKWSIADQYSDIFNKSFIPAVSGYYMGDFFQSGQLDIFLNGIYLSNSEYLVSGQYIYILDRANTDTLIIDMSSGKSSIPGSGSFSFNYTGQEVYLNGVNLISGYDFTTSGMTLYLTGYNTGISGYLLSSSISLPFVTGNFQIKPANSFARNTSSLYLNGVRQKNYADYIEGGFDLLNNNFFDENNNKVIYGYDEQFWK